MDSNSCLCSSIQTKLFEHSFSIEKLISLCQKVFSRSVVAPRIRRLPRRPDRQGQGAPRLEDTAGAAADYDYEYEYIDNSNEFEVDVSQRDEDKRFKRRPDTAATSWMEEPQPGPEELYRRPADLYRTRHPPPGRGAGGNHLHRPYHRPKRQKPRPPASLLQDALHRFPGSPNLQQWVG